MIWKADLFFVCLYFLLEVENLDCLNLKVLKPITIYNKINRKDFEWMIII